MRPSNPFESGLAAKYYTQGRPFFHPLVVARIKAKLAGETVDRVLDVGCGTGLSSKALMAISKRIDAIDSSAAMLEEAFRDARIHYRQQSAETLDYPESVFDLITVSQAIHWTDRERFFAGAYLSLKAGGFVVLYDNFFLWGASAVEPVVQWFLKSYLKKFPPPARNRVDLNSKGEVRPSGFVFEGCEEYTNTLSLNKTALIDFLVTQSNVVSALERNDLSLDEARSWLGEQLGPLFEGDLPREFQFGGPIYYLLKE